MVAKHEHTPLWVRLWHWTLAALFLILVYTGVALTFSGARFAIMDYELATTLHDVTGVSLIVLYVLFLVAAVATGYWRSYVDRSQGLLRRIGRQSLLVLKWSPRKTEHVGQRRLDTMQPLLLLLQQFLYLISLTVILPLLAVTGLFYLYPETAPNEVLGFAGLWLMALAHYVSGLLGTVFIAFHIYISTVAGLKRMIWG